MNIDHRAADGRRLGQAFRRERPGPLPHRARRMIHDREQSRVRTPRGRTASWF